jgi:pimeloyl-ACP methyl ester carboxylesterase
VARGRQAKSAHDHGHLMACNRGAAGVNLHVREYGKSTGIPILLIHGWSQSHLCWSNQYESPLKDDARIVALDLRDHGSGGDWGVFVAVRKEAIVGWNADVVTAPAGAFFDVHTKVHESCPSLVKPSSPHSRWERRAGAFLS